MLPYALDVDKEKEVKKRYRRVLGWEKVVITVIQLVGE